MKCTNPTRHGAAVVARKAKNGRTTFSLKYHDAAGELVWERLGTDADGWTRRAARDELEQRLVDVRRDGYRKPSGMTFAELARDWLATYPAAKALKRSTSSGYRTIVETHLIPCFGDVTLDRFDVALLDRYVGERLERGLSAGSVNRHLNVVSLIVRAGRKRGLLRQNPVELVDRPAEPRRRWRIMTPAEVGRVQVAFDQLLADAEDDDVRAWVRQCRQVFVVTYATGLRRGELLGLRWSRVQLADPAGPSLRIEETFVRDRVETPKSVASARTIPLGPVAAEVLFERFADSAYQSDADRVFCHSATGGPFDRKAYADTFRSALTRAGITDYVRPFHDGRHTALTNGAAAGVPPAALQASAGHADMSTTQRYIDLAGVRFKAEAELAEARMFGTAATAEEIG